MVRALMTRRPRTSLTTYAAKAKVLLALIVFGRYGVPRRMPPYYLSIPVESNRPLLPKKVPICSEHQP